MKCQACNGTGGTVVYCGDACQWSFRPDSCPDCEGTGRLPDPCPACGQHGHAMSQESGPGPLCSPRVQP